MKTAVYRTAAALLAALLLLGLTACAADGGREVRRIDWVTSPAYTAEDIPLPVQTGDLIGCCTDGEYMYILADEKTGDQVRSVLSRVDLSDGGTLVLEGYKAAPLPGEDYMNRLGPVMGPDGTLWVYEAHTILRYDLPEDFDLEQDRRMEYLTGQDDFCHLRQLDPATGREKELIDLSDAIQALDISGFGDISGLAVDGEGNAYFAGPGGVAVLDGGSRLLFTLEADMPSSGVGSSTSGGKLALLPDGTVAALTLQPGGREVRTIDPAAKGWGSGRYELPNGVDLVYGGTGGFLFFYLAGGNFYGWEPEGEEGRLLLNRASVDLPGSLLCFAPLDGGRLAALTSFNNASFSSDDYWYSTNIRLSMHTPSDKKPEEGRIKLIYGTFTEDRYLNYQISRFNEENDRYYIELRNYSGEGVNFLDMQYSGDERAAAEDAARKLLSAEVASGSIPDVWDKSMPLDLYARKGYFEDLWPWIDGDAELGGRDALMSHVLDCASIDGKLYKAVNSFSIRTAAVRPEVAAGRNGWTLEELLDACRSLPEDGSLLEKYVTGGELLSRLLEMDLDRWVDWSTGECFFDTQAFRDVLALCARLPAEYDYQGYDMGEDLRAGRQLMTDAWLGAPSHMDYFDALFGGPEALWDYGKYLEDNGLSSYGGMDENGEPLIFSRALSALEACRREGVLYGYYALSGDAVFGAVEGGGYVSYIGYPTQSGTGSCFLLPNSRSVGGDNALAMSAACRNKEGAWAFIRRLLLPEDPEGVILQGDGEGNYLYQINSFPINKSMFEAAMTPNWVTYEDAEGDRRCLLDGDGNRIEEPRDLLRGVPNSAPASSMVIYPLSPGEEQREQLMALYNAIDRVQAENDDLLDIILEQAQPCFAGDKTLDETADLIQRRAALYVNENR